MTRARSALMVSTEGTKKQFDADQNDDGSNRFVTNLRNEMEAEQEGTLNDLDKNFFISHFTKCVNQITDSHHEILDAFMSKRDTEDAIEKKHARKLAMLRREANEVKIENIDLRHKNKSIVEELSDLKKTSASDTTKRITEITLKKNTEISKLRLEVKTLKLEVMKEKGKQKEFENPKRLAEEKLAHSKTKEVLSLKLKNKEDLIDMLKREKSDLTSRYKDISKKLDVVEKEFRAFSKSHALLVTKQKGQLTLQKTKNSDKLRERNEKSAQKAESFLRLQQSMRSAVGVGSFHSQSNDCGRSFRDVAPPYCNNTRYFSQSQTPMLNTQPPSIANIANYNGMIGQENFPFVGNNLSRATQLQSQQDMMGLSIQSTKKRMMGDNMVPSSDGTTYDFQQDDYPSSSQSTRKRKNRKRPKKVVSKINKPTNVARKLPTRRNYLADYDFTRSPTSPSSDDTDESTTPSTAGLSQPLI